MSRAAMQQAFEALVAAYQGKDKTGQVTEAITALKQALAEPQTTHWEGCEAVHPECRKQEPVAWMSQGGDVARSKRYLEKMGFSNLIPLYTAPTPQPDTDCHAQGICQRSGYSITPTPRRPLTDEEIDAVYIGCKHGSINEFARAIERAHGIGEQHE